MVTPSTPRISPPAVVAHADWSVHPAKRWVAVARLGRDGRYRAAAPRPVGELSRFLDGLAAMAGGGAVLLGVDFPIGLPRAYARRVGVEHFRTLLPQLGRGRWAEFFTVAGQADEISLARPFFPARAVRRGEVSRRQLLDGLGMADYGALLRRCDHATGSRPAAAAMFWTLGPQQVGKAAIAGWRDLLVPARRAGRDLAIWPFDGPLEQLLAPGRIVVAETYPGEIYGHVGVRLRRGGRGGKRRQADRAANGPALVERARSLAVRLDPALRKALEAGFGPAADGEDPFDASVGLIGMLNVVLGARLAGEPDDGGGLAVEGWILGLDAHDAPARS